jgi:hypothetical protein
MVFSGQEDDVVPAAAKTGAVALTCNVLACAVLKGNGQFVAW